ncbi:uncharacterized protein BKCO1_4100024 [Diplodia corticola]|uniref:Uncharacterized protein n=1 Tax=Diplodia corticola TaxID=236234 RepID=A0A1J9QUL9_9PEZI|nr:uncharacterized protein BKCO1_4100024 [Diplodia corticola]OJD32136.1 hypothetical protein BKCO1_4100024 [Diplodia corticola]
MALTPSSRGGANDAFAAVAGQQSTNRAALLFYEFDSSAHVFEAIKNNATLREETSWQEHDPSVVRTPVVESPGTGEVQPGINPKPSATWEWDDKEKLWYMMWAFAGDTWCVYQNGCKYKLDKANVWKSE